MTPTVIKQAKAINAKKQRLRNLLERLHNGDDVATRDLRNAVTSDEYEHYEQMWEHHKNAASYSSGSSGYDELLKQGLFHYNKAESGRFNKDAKNRFYRKAEACFEKAIEQLKADVSLDPSVADAYDRHLDFSAQGYNLSLSPTEMPRRIASKSTNNLSDVHGGVRAKLTKRDFKIRVVEQSLKDFEERKEYKVSKGRKVSAKERAAIKKRETAAESASMDWLKRRFKIGRGKGAV